MPNDPKNPVEEQLKAWAHKRRGEAGAPFELTPAMRKLLQDEVARTYPQPAATPPAAQVAWWKLLWPRLAVAGSICALFVIMLGLVLPALSKAKTKAQQISAVSQLKVIGLAARIYASDHEGKLPANFQQMREELGGASADKVIKDPASGKEFVYLGASNMGTFPHAILAYSPTEQAGSRSVLLVDGSVITASEARFNEALKSTLNDRGTTTLAAARDTRERREIKPTERELLAQAESKDARLKVDEIVHGVELASSDKSQQAAVPPAASAGRNSNVANERDQTLLRQRYGLVPGQAGGVATRSDDSRSKNKAPSAPQVSSVPGPRLALEGAKLEPGAVGVGFAGGPASNATAALSPALNNLQYGVQTENSQLALAQPARSAARESVVSLADQGKMDWLGTGNTYAFKAGVAPAQAALSYSQARRYRVNLNSPPMPNVLRSFEVAQNGQQIRVVDADGSVYDGAMEPPPFAEIGKELLAKGPTATDLKKSLEPQEQQATTAAATIPSQIAPQNSFFRVAG